MTHQPRHRHHPKPAPPSAPPPDARRDALRVVPAPTGALNQATHPNTRHATAALTESTRHATAALTESTRHATATPIDNTRPSTTTATHPSTPAHAAQAAAALAPAGLAGGLVRHPARLMLIVALTLAAAMAVRMATAEPAAARLGLDTVFGEVADNPVEAMVGTAIDDPAYDRATHCVKQPTKGARALVAWLPKISPRGVNWGINRCERWGKNSASLHAEGRAVDWHLDVKNSADRAEAERVIRLLLAPDSDGNPHALARRLGVQGLIWNCQAWWGGEGLVRYSVCNGKDGKLNPKVDPTTAHRDHIHLELNKSAARLNTSWWTDGPGRAAARSVR